MSIDQNNTTIVQWLMGMKCIFVDFLQFNFSFTLLFLFLFIGGWWDEVSWVLIELNTQLYLH